MQLAVIEYARDVCGLNGATSAEFEAGATHKVIDFMNDQRDVTAKGGTMRLGSYPCIIAAGSVAAKIYGKTEISERHRHRYEVNNAYREPLEKAGLVLSGTSPDGKLVEMIELPNHPHFVACQFHPEFESRPTAAHPLFVHFVRAAFERRSAAAAAAPKPSDKPEGTPLRAHSVN
jgi:CTP synthase